MDLTQLRYFQVVARECHITRAANKLFISQPSLTGDISRLEKEIGVSLFDHKGRNIVLNENGKLLLAHVDKILFEYDSCIKALNKRNDIEKTTVHLGVTGINFPRTLIKAFVLRYPNYKISQALVGAQDVLDTLLYENADFIISTVLPESNKIDFCTLWKEQIFAVVPFSHRLAQKKRASLNDFANDNLICLPKGQAFRDLIEKLCIAAGFRPNIAIECFPGQMADYVKNSIGVALVAASSVESGEFKRAGHAVQLEGPANFRFIYLIWKKDAIFATAAKSFLEFAQSIYEHTSRT
ncbi:MAG: LysR family transcriptional regulator [Succiniclasticum sp.]